jgi:hypothetical protein
MKRSLLESDLQNLGLSEEDVRSHLPFLGEAAEADVEDDFEMEEDFEDETVDEDDLFHGLDEAALEVAGDLEAAEELDEEYLDLLRELSALEEGAIVQRMKKGTAKARRAAKAYYRKMKAKISRGMKRKRKTSGFKRRQAKLARAPKASGARTRRVVSDRDVPASNMHEDIMESLGELAESLEREPTTRFDEYAEAFNSVADIGELLCLRAVNEDELELAQEAYALTLFAENALRGMEELGGALIQEDDEELEEALAIVMEELGGALEDFNLFEDEDLEDDELDEDFEDEDFELDEGRGAKTAKRPKPAAGRLIMKGGMPKKVKGKSNYSKTMGGAKPRRKDWRNKAAMIGFLRKVKAGKAAPGHPASKFTDKKGRFNLGAAKAKAAAGK